MSWKVKEADNKVAHCSLLGEKVSVFLHQTPLTKIKVLMDKYPHQEWCGYMTGEIKEGVFDVKDISIPPHAEASGASAEAEPFNVPENCIGFIHSHNTMRAFHSGTDQAHVDYNYPLSITVAKRTTKLEFDIISNRKTECGRWLTAPGIITVVQPKPDFDVDEWVKGATANIDKGKKTYVQGDYVSEYAGYPFLPEAYPRYKPSKSYQPYLINKDRTPIFVNGERWIPTGEGHAYIQDKAYKKDTDVLEQIPDDKDISVGIDDGQGMLQM
jgi:hypothetical protein